MLIIVDAMGGDHAPESNVNGAIDAIMECEGFDILLLGDAEKIGKIIKTRNFRNPRLSVQHTSEVITSEDTPTKAIKAKKESSMVVGFELLKGKRGDAFVSAGNSGALMAGALFILGRMKGIDRPGFPAIIPTMKGDCILIDAGLNTACKPINYYQFAIMGSIYAKLMNKSDKPKVGLINVGSEDNKGNENIKQAFELLEKSNLNFIGNIEGKDIPLGKVDVAVCDGFVGNVVLKFLEGCATYFFGSIKGIFMSSMKNKLAASVLKKDFKDFVSTVDPDVNGGAPILGVNGLVVKSHGSSNAKAIKNVIIKRAYGLAQQSIQEKIGKEFAKLEV